MRAVVIRQFGDPRQLHVEEVPQPQPGEGEALVKVLAAGINPSDVGNVQGRMAGTTLPRVPGRDFAGVVVAGPAEAIGREVWGTGGDVGFTRDGSHAEYILLPVTALQEKPGNLAMEIAGSVGVTFVTAWYALVQHAGIRSSDTVLILGAAGGVGSAATQIARSFGATVIAAVRRSEQSSEARESGAAQIIDTSASNLEDEVRRLTGDRGADVVFDTTGHLFAESIAAAAHGGRVCVISAPASGTVTFNLRSLYRKELKVVGTDSRKFDVTASSGLLAKMRQGFEEGTFKAAPARPFPLERAAEAYGEAMDGKGRVSLIPHP